MSKLKKEFILPRSTQPAPVPDPGLRANGTRMPRKLTHQMKMFIQSHVYDPEWTDERFGKELNVDPHTVAVYRRKEGYKRKSGEVSVNIVDIKIKIKNTQNYDEKKNLLKIEFMHSPRFSRLKEIFDSHDLILVIDKWIDYKIQLPDMTTSEEDVLEKMLILDLRIMYNQKSMRTCQQNQDSIRAKQSSKPELDPDNEQDLMLMQLITSKNGEEIEINKQYSLLLKEYNSLQESLNATRRQREDKLKIGADTFFDLIKSLNQKDVREQIGKINEYQKRAMSKKMSDLKKPHQYLDNVVDVPILDGESVRNKAENREEENDETENSGDNGG